MSLPANVSYGTVKGRFILAYGDTVDVNLNPDATPAAGSIFFTASPILLKNVTASPDPVTILPAIVEVQLDADGYLRTHTGTDGLGVRLIATDDPDNNPEDWTWRVDFRLTDQSGTPVSLPSFSFSLPSNSVLDLTELTPVPNSNGVFYLNGPKGDKGDKGDTGDIGLTGPEGPEGPQGIQGVPGDGIDVIGTVSTSSNLPTSGVALNDAYVTNDTGNLWIWSAGNVWVNAGLFRGAGVPAGGAVNTLLIKSGSADYETAWTNTIEGGTA